MSEIPEHIKNLHEAISKLGDFLPGTGRKNAFQEGSRSAEMQDAIVDVHRKGVHAFYADKLDEFVSANHTKVLIDTLETIASTDQILSSEQQVRAKVALDKFYCLRYGATYSEKD